MVANLFYTARLTSTLDNNKMHYDETELSYSPKGLGKFIRHSGAVFPLEAYGFLLGEKLSANIVTAIPVGKTTKWYDYSDRFGRIENALNLACDVSSEFDLEVVGVYHSHSDCRCDSPLNAVPENFKNAVTCIKDVSGGDLDIWPCRFYIAGREVTARKVSLPNSPKRNPRRIHSAWISSWGAIDYDNGYEQE